MTMAKSSKFISLCFAFTLLCHLQHDLSQTYVNGGLSRSNSRPRSPQHLKISSAAFGGGFGGGGSGGGYGRGSSAQGQLTSTAVLIAIIGVIMFAGYKILSDAEAGGWKGPSYAAPAAAPAAAPKDRSTYRSEALNQIMDKAAAEQGFIEKDRFEKSKAAPSLGSSAPPLLQLDGSELPSTFPNTFRSPLSDTQQNSARNLLPERYSGSARPLNSVL